MSAPAVAGERVDRAIACLREHPRATAASTFVYAVLASCARRKLATIEAETVRSLAEEHGIERGLVDTPAGNLAEILERGPRNELESHVVGAFAVAGFGEVCLAGRNEERRSAVRALLELVEWIELATSYRLTPFLGLLLPGEVRGIVEDALLDGLLVPQTAPASDGTDGAARARAIVRLTALVRAQSDAARSALARVSERASDPATRAVARALLADQLASRTEDGLRVQGVAAAPPRRLSVALFRWLTGIALLSALYRLACFLIALRREGEIELEGGVLRVRRRTTFLGRTVRSHEACYTVDRISGAFRRARFALLGSAIGVISLSCGILLGGHLLFDGSRGGAPVLLIAGAVVVLLGAALDLALEILVPARAGRVEVQVDVSGARSVRLSRVPLPDADRLLAALAQRVAREP